MACTGGAGFDNPSEDSVGLLAMDGGADCETLSCGTPRRPWEEEADVMGVAGPEPEREPEKEAEEAGGRLELGSEEPNDELPKAEEPEPELEPAEAERAAASKEPDIGTITAEEMAARYKTFVSASPKKTPPLLPPPSSAPSAEEVLKVAGLPHKFGRSGPLTKRGLQRQEEGGRPEKKRKHGNQ